MADLIEMERSLLHRILQGDLTICSHTATTLGDYIFSEEWTNWAWLFTKQQFQDSGEIPERTIIEAQAGHLPSAEADLLMAEVAAIFGTPATLSPRSLIRLLLQKANTDAALKVMERASEKFATGDAEEAKRILATGMRDRETAPGPRAKPLFPRKFTPLMNAHRIRTGLHQLDEIIGGIQECEAGLVYGVTGMGKSALSTSLGHAGVVQRVPTLHIDTENGEHITRSRYISRFTGIPARLIEQNTMGKETRLRLDTWLERNNERLARYLQVIYLGMEEHSMDDVESAIIAAKHNGFTPRLAIFDSPDHVVMDEMDEAARWEKFAAVANRWKRTCERHKFGGWAVSQADASYEAKLATGRSVADSKQKIRNASIAMSINHALHPKTHQPLPGDQKCLLLQKSRNSKAGTVIPLLTDLDRMLIKSPPGFKHITPEDGETADLDEETA